MRLAACFGQSGCEVDLVRVIALLLAPLVAIAQLLIELFHEAIEDGVGVVTLGGGHHVGAADDDLGGYAEEMLLPVLALVMQSDVDADDVRIVSKQDGEFFPDGGFQGRRQFNVDALHGDLGGIDGLMIHRER